MRSAPQVTQFADPSSPSINSLPQAMQAGCIYSQQRQFDKQMTPPPAPSLTGRTTPEEQRGAG